MCGLCGVLGATHWSDSHASPEAFGDGAGGRTRRGERLYRVRLVNEVLQGFALDLSDFQGTSFVVSSRTGRSEMVGDLMAVWPTAEQMIGRKLDPLDPEVVTRLEQAVDARG
ncbi:hypothetical protein [Algihabitans albus]|uniref:hypothetical protein n=1 Tax=Algihabitans albus TaxID=2164067 RepID=UPI000E5D40B6|nr:hypothetical protein [Algihabitans albus]